MRPPRIRKGTSKWRPVKQNVKKLHTKNQAHCEGCFPPFTIIFPLFHEQMLTPKRTREQTDACQSLKAPGMECKSMFSCIYSEQFMPINVKTSELSNSNFRITPLETGLQLQLEKNHPRRIVLFPAMLRKGNIPRM